MDFNIRKSMSNIKKLSPLRKIKIARTVLKGLDFNNRGCKPTEKMNVDHNPERVEYKYDKNSTLRILFHSFSTGFTGGYSNLIPSG